jgi:hypothetical protein
MAKENRRHLKKNATGDRESGRRWLFFNVSKGGIKINYELALPSMTGVPSIFTRINV